LASQSICGYGPCCPRLHTCLASLYQLTPAAALPRLLQTPKAKKPAAPKVKKTTATKKAAPAKKAAAKPKAVKKAVAKKA
jgi:hypothetical protein